MDKTFLEIEKFKSNDISNNILVAEEKRIQQTARQNVGLAFNVYWIVCKVVSFFIATKSDLL